MLLWRTSLVDKFLPLQRSCREVGEMMKGLSPREEVQPPRSPLCPSQRPSLLTGRRRCIAGICVLCVLLLAACALPPAHAQSMPTVSRAGDLQLGGGFVFAHSDYNFTPIRLIGEAAYTDFAMRPHWGGEFNFRRVTSSQDSTVRETTFEVGPRIFVTRWRFTPYAKVLYGRGVYNFSNNIANIAYNRSEEHTSELQSLRHLVCRLLLE